jgi:hypothetical protein
MENIMIQEPLLISDQKSDKSPLFSKDFFKNGLVHWTLITALLLNVINWIILVYFIRPVDFPITLHYNVYFGVDMIGAWWQAYFLPAIGLALLMVNTMLGYFFYQQKDRIIGHILLLATCIVQISVFIAVISIVIINY